MLNVSVPEISRQSRPQLASKVRLRFDRKGERYMLLYPEKGLLLNGTAAEIVKLCTGDLSVAAIIEKLAAQFGQDARTIEPQVMSLLVSLAERGLVKEAA